MGKTGTGGSPWVVLETPRPPRVADHYAFWRDPPPMMSARCWWWLRQIQRGWRPPRRVRYMGYDSTAQWYGVFMWEYLNLIYPATELPREPAGRPVNAIDAWFRSPGFGKSRACL
jgi:hypothetical protein